ncbi:hypothetical protein, partial [uncultured Brachyspira sp.]|uniref:hypothetical protein n=1 Tax=uncultured Brachyspira sp. TaxID=221953 RepID=UPI0026349D85
HTAHSTQHTAHSTQHTAHSTQHTAHNNSIKFFSSKSNITSSYSILIKIIISFGAANLFFKYLQHLFICIFNIPDNLLNSNIHFVINKKLLLGVSL